MIQRGIKKSNGLKTHYGWRKWTGLWLCFFAMPAFAAGTLGDVLQQAMITNIPDKALVCFADQMEVSVLGKSVVCNNQQAVEILRSFMESHPVASCQIVHKGKKQTAGFYIMSVISASQKQFRIYALERTEQTENLIRQFRIDEVIE